MTDTRDSRDIVERLRALSNSIGDEAADIIEAHRNSIDALVAGWNKDRAELTRLRSQRVAVPEWQDISTAPKDETVLGAVDGEVRLIRWCKASHVPFHGWCLVDQGAEDRDLCVPTNWMPRPTPPSAAIRSLAHGGDDDQA